MVNLFGIKVGSYLYYERCNSEQLSDQPIDNSVKVVTNFEQLKDNKLGIQQNIMENLLQNNSDLFVCFEGDVPLGMMWGHSGSCYVRGPGIPIIQGKDSVYWFWIFTLPEARGKNIFKRLKNAFFTHYKDSRCFTALVEPSNSIMRSEMDKIGFKETKQYYYVKLSNTALIIEQSCRTKKINFHIEMGNQHNLVLI